MTEEEKARIEELKKVPKPVHFTTLAAFALGLVILIRMPAAAYATHLSVGRGFFFGLLTFSWFFICGCSLYTRNRWGYLALAAFSLLPLLGVLGMSIHLIRLTLDSNLSASWPDTIHCSVCVLQLITTIVLLRYLLMKQVRDFVWKPAT